MTKVDDTSSCITKYEEAITDLISKDISLGKIKEEIFKDNNILDKYISGIDIKKITKYNARTNYNNESYFKNMEEDIKYLLRVVSGEDIVSENYPKINDYKLLYINSIHLLNVIHLINNYKKEKEKDKTKYENILKLYKLQYKYYYLTCVKLRNKDGKYYHFIKKDDDNITHGFTYEINEELTNIAYPSSHTTGGKKSLSVNKIKEIADKLKVSHSKCNSKESIMNEIKSIDLQKLTIEQLKIYCKLFNIKDCSKCKSKKSLLPHIKSNMKVH